MQFHYHLGAHCTDEDRILRCMLKNKSKIAKTGTIVPGPGKYRPVIRQALVSLKGQSAPPEMQQAMLDQFLDPTITDMPDRIFFASDGFICAPRYVVGLQRIYPMITEKVQRLQGLFPTSDIGFSMAIRNPATFIPALFHRMEHDQPFAEMIAPVDLRALKWSSTILELRQALPNAEITVWCDEDSLLIWPEILQQVANHADDLTLDGINEFYGTLMTEAGLERMDAYLAKNAPANAAQRQRIVAAFLDKFARADALEDEFDLPGWSEEVIWELTRAYEADLDEIEKIQGVTFLRA